MSVSEQQGRILSLLCDGKEIHEAAAALHIADSTMGTHLKRIKERLPAKSTLDAAVRWALMQPPPEPEQFADKNLTPMQMRVLNVLADGFNPGEIGDKLHLAVNTVSTHIRRAMEKLRAKTTIQLAVKWARIKSDPKELNTWVVLY